MPLSPVRTKPSECGNCRKLGIGTLLRLAPLTEKPGVACLSGSSCGSWELDPAFDILSPGRELSLGKPHGLHLSLRHVARVTQSEPRGVGVQVMRWIRTRLLSGQVKAVCQPVTAGALSSMASQGQREPSHSTVDCLTSKCSSEHSLCLSPSISLVT